MSDKPSRADGYKIESLELVRRTCLYLATKLGDLLEDIVLVGGLVPSLLVDQSVENRHVGTTDLDLGLALAVLNEERYHEIAKRLRAAGFGPDTNEDGKPTRQRWRIGDATVDFLMPPLNAKQEGGRIQSLEADFGALIIPGLDLAFRDRERRTLEGLTLKDEKAKRDIWVCGPGAFLVLKALAFDKRGENKDAYDLFYVLKYVGVLADIGVRLRSLLDSPETRQALVILERDLLDRDGVGPRRVAEFLTGGPDDAIQADVVGLVVELLAAVGLPGRS